MYLKKSGKFELWGGVHPSSIGCASEGRSVCDCKYHIVDDQREQIESFDTFQDAEDRFCVLTGTQKFVLGKSTW